MATSITIVLRDPVTGAGLPNQAAKLRVGPGFGADTYTMADVTGKAGSYKVDNVASGTYKLFVNGVEDKSFGGDNGREIFLGSDILFKSGGTMTGGINMNSNAITNLPVPGTNDEPETKGRVATFLATVATNLTNAIATCLLKAGGTMSGAINMNGNRIQNLPAAGADSDALSKGESKSFFPLKSAGSPNQIINAPWIFNGWPYKTSIATNLLHIINRKDMLDYVQGIMSGLNPTAFQQSGNIIRVLFSGTQEDNKAYRTIAAAISNATGFAAANHEITIVIEGRGVDGATLTNYNLFAPPGLDPYIHIVGLVPNIVLRVGEDTYEGEINYNKIIGVTIDNENDAAETTFHNYTFVNVEFQNTFGTGIYNLVNCHLINCRYGIGVTINQTDCIGDIYNFTLERRYWFSGGTYVHTIDLVIYLICFYL